MEHNRNIPRPEAATDEPASSVEFQQDNDPADPDSAAPGAATRAGGDRPAEPPDAAPPDPPNFEPPPLLSDCLDEALAETLAETFPPDGPKPRHDGWTPEAVTGFLRHLAAVGIVDHAARAVGLSASSAYAFRNRRQGRAFAKMWDAVLIHRARARIASELQGRAIAGCVSIRKRDGVVVGEYHYYDNRLAMALLSRLDRLAEREATSEAQLRALSEDLDDYCDCVAAGGDADAFVEARKPVEPEPAPAPAPAPMAAAPDNDPELTTLARISGCPDYRDVDPLEIEVRDLDPGAKADWSPEQWVRAYRSGFMHWLEILANGDSGFEPGPGAPFNYFFEREAAMAALDAFGSAEPAPDGERGEIDTHDLDTASIRDWTDDQLARAWRGGTLSRLPRDFWDDLAAAEARDGEEE